MPERVENMIKIRTTDYLVILTFELNCYLIVEVLNKACRICWQSRFDCAQIESLTETAGVLKKFSSFIAMLRAALFQTSDNVSLDIARRLKNREKSREELERNPSMPSRESSESSKTTADRVFLKLLYRSEFEACTYVLPLDNNDTEQSFSQSLKKSHESADKFPERQNAQIHPEKQNNLHRFAVLQLEARLDHLSKDKDKLRDELSRTKTSLRQSEARELSLIEDAERLKRKVGKQMIALKSHCDKRLQHLELENKLLTHDLTLTRREVSSLKAQLRRAQTEIALYSRRFRPGIVNSPAAVREHSPHCYLRKQTDLPTHRPNPSTNRRASTLDRTHSAGAGGKTCRADVSEPFRSRSYSPGGVDQSKPRFELHIIKHNRSASLDQQTRQRSVDNRAYGCRGKFAPQYNGTTDPRSTSPSLASSPTPFQLESRFSRKSNHEMTAKGDYSRQSSPLFVAKKDRAVTPSPTRPLYGASRFVDSDDEVTAGQRSPARPPMMIMDDVSARAKFLLQKYRRKNQCGSSYT
ncbi:centrosomal protein CCDC61-like [Paramacrobiotus metropolitanus]|uniref:centrosomal protein CCDC61-like n=1 Tax=Paramacrobiotus metropolitanus TaxID=2943436 RepID=UPI0024460218|nr:centrosomal protein CCDC61-like [Paramacrobiotus metropolitanus]